MECIVSFIALILDKVCDIIFTLSSLANLFTVIGLPLTAYAIYYAKKAFEKQNEALELQKKDSDEQKILGAWSLLAQKGTGDLGRKDALEFLHSKGKSLVGLDLSNAHLAGLKLNGANLTGCNFTGANLEDAVFEGAMLYDSHFEGANLWKANFEGADLGYAHFEGANLYTANFEGAKHIQPANFKNCYTSGDNKLPTAPEDYEFVFEANEDGTQKTEFVNGLKCYRIKLIKTETKNP
jgi:hypothetical protein